MQSLGKGFKPIVVGTTIKMANESTGEVIDTGMTTDKMTEEAKITLQNLGRVEAAKQAGVNAAAVAGINQSEVYTDGKGNYWQLNPNQVQDAATMGLRPVGNAPKFPSGQINPVQPAARAPVVAPRQARNDAFQKFADDRPDLAAKWLIPPISATGNWGIKPPPKGRDGWLWDTPVDPNEMAEYNMVREALGMPPMPQAQPAAQPVQGNPRVGPTAIPQMPQGQMGTVAGQQPAAPIESQPQPQIQTQPQTKAEADQMIASGQMLLAMDRQGRRYIIPNTQQGIEAALRANLRIQTPQGQ
jgi:hypothetical protein